MQGVDGLGSLFGSRVGSFPSTYLGLPFRESCSVGFGLGKIQNETILLEEGGTFGELEDRLLR